MDQELIARSMRDLAREFDSCRDLLVALGNENRQLIFMALLESHGGARVGELAERVGLSHPATSHHLKVLREAGLVESRRVGTRSFYHASTRLDRWGELARVTSDAERFVRAMVALEARGEGCSRRDGKDVSDREERPDDHDSL